MSRPFGSGAPSRTAFPSSPSRPAGVRTAPRSTGGYQDDGGGTWQEGVGVVDSPAPVEPVGTPHTLPMNSPSRNLNPYGRSGNPYAPGWQAGRATTADPFYQWQKASDALANEQYNQDMNALLRQRAALANRGGGGGNRAAYNAAMQALESDRARLAADQTLSAEQRRFAGTNLELSNRSQRGALMSDAVSRGADTSTGVIQNYTDITDRNQLNYDQSIAQANRNDAYLSQLAKDYGVKEEQIKAALTRGASAYGMSYANAMAQIDDAMNSLDMNRRAAALQAQFMILREGGMPSGLTPKVSPHSSSPTSTVNYKPTSGAF